MISAEQFSRLPSLWRDIAPMLDHAVQAMNADGQGLLKSVRSQSASHRNALISEAAFVQVASLAPDDPVDPLAVERAARSHLEMLPDQNMGPAALSPDEWHEVEGLTANLRHYITREVPSDFLVPIPGCGLVKGGVADILRESEVIEVKSVQRMFQAPDLRQALTYVALLGLQGRKIEKVTLLNPRRGRVASAEVDVVTHAASGLRASEFMHTLVGLMAIQESI